MLHGEKLSKPSYAIVRSLRGGSVGEAWLTEHEVFGKRVVQKTYDTFGVEDSVARREPTLLRDIEHPHVALVYEAQFDPDFDHAITFVMPYYEGGCIATALDEGYAFSIHECIKLGGHVLEALAHVHTAHRYIHRDVKPGNIFLDAERANAYLGDFGSAAELDARGWVPAIAGSPLYTAPEGGPDDGELGVGADVYGVGITMFEMLNGPFLYAEISPEEVEKRLAAGRRALPNHAFESWEPHIPDNVRTVIRKAIRVAPRDRYTSCSQFIRQLQRIRCIDWKRVDGSDLDGAWAGTWPPQMREERRRRYRVTSRVLRGSRRRLIAVESISGTAWRRFGVEDATISPADRRAVERFFSEVATRAAQRAPAR